MFCPKCGKINPDSEEFCSGCNAPLHEKESEAPAPKKGNFVRILVAVIIVVVAAVVVVTSLGGCAKRHLPPGQKIDISF